MERKTNLKLATRLLVLLCLMFAGVIVASVLSVLVINQGLLSMLTLQDILSFIVPALLAMAILSSKTATTLAKSFRRVPQEVWRDKEG